MGGGEDLDLDKHKYASIFFYNVYFSSFQKIVNSKFMTSSHYVRLSVIYTFSFCLHGCYIYLYIWWLYFLWMLPYLMYAIFINVLTDNLKFLRRNIVQGPGKWWKALLHLGLVCAKSFQAIYNYPINVKLGMIISRKVRFILKA